MSDSDRARLREELMQAPVAMSIVRGPDYVYELANPLYEKMIGRGGFEGKSLRDAFPELGEDSPVLTMMRGVYEKKEAARASEFLVMLDRDGSGSPRESYFDFTVQPMMGPDGDVEGAMTVAVDVTAQVLARRVAEMSSARFALLARIGVVLEEADDMLAGLQALARLLTPTLGDIGTVSIVEDDGTIHRLADSTSTSDIGAAISVARSAPMPEAMLTIVREALATGRPRLVRDYQKEVLAKSPADDPYRQALTSVSPRTAIFAPLRARGRSLGFITVALSGPGRDYAPEDVELAEVVAHRAGLALAHAQLLAREKAARTEAETANRLKDQFLATMGHELRTPLNAILGWAQVLSTPGMESRAQTAVETITRNARAQARLIDDLIDISRITAQKLLFDSKRLDLSALVRAAVETVRPSAAEKKLALDVDVRDGVFVLGDPTRLDQVIWNLLSNATKFTPVGGRVRIGLALAGDDGALARLTVSDAGQGIPAAVLPRIFERFVQADSSSTRRHGGLGLGLAIAKSIVEMHKGTIAAASEGENKGATFSVELPVAEDATPEE